LANRLPKGRSLLFFFGALALMALMSIGGIIKLLVDYQWFKEVGYIGVFFTRLFNGLKVGIPLFVLLFVLLYTYLKGMQKDFYSHSGMIPSNVEKKALNRVFVLASLAVSFFIILSLARSLWMDIYKYINASYFGVTDPIFDMDIGFYMFKLPFLRHLLSIMIFLSFVLIAAAVVFYSIMISLNASTMFKVDDQEQHDLRRRFLSNRGLFNLAAKQIAKVGFILLVILALRFYLSRYSLLFSPAGVTFGAGYTDIQVTLRVYMALAAVAVLSAIMIVYAAFSKKYRIALYGPALLIVISIIGNIAAMIVQNFIVEPNEFAREEKYIRYNIEYTHKAYGLDSVQEKEFEAAQSLDYEDIQENRATIDNIRINDYRPALQVYNQLQGIRLYYRFNDVDIDRYYIDGHYTQVFLSARELSQDNLREEAQNWINKYLKYTHGYGVVMSPVNRVTAQGQPELLIKDIPPVTETQLIINRPEIYFGEITDDYIITNTRTGEFDYPLGDDNKEAFYQGTAGIKLSLPNRLLFAIYNGSAKILLSGDISSESRIIINRNILDRAKKIAPYFMYDDDPYIVIDQGKLYWIIDAYTYDNGFPYSQPVEHGINYIRNPIKVTVDAYNGDIKFYIIDRDEAISKTYQRIFPGLFTPFEQMPEGIKSHIRYPQALFDIQAEVYKDYHMDNTQVFYNREDAWDISLEQYANEVLEVESNYQMLKLPDAEKEEFLLTVPYTPAKKSNLTSLLIARNDGDKYGQLLVYKMPKNKLVYGPMQLESRISQDPTISRQLSLWDQRGTEVIRGNLIIIPIETSLLYVEPLYLKAANESSLPEMRRVIVGYQDTIVMEETLDAALEVIFGQAPSDAVIDEPLPQPDDTGDATLEELIGTANRLFESAQQAIRNGEWAKYGEYIAQLEDVLAGLQGLISE
jgi:uncharacterized membrane protein (UPF0182 family)